MKISSPEGIQIDSSQLAISEADLPLPAIQDWPICEKKSGQYLYSPKSERLLPASSPDLNYVSSYHGE